MADTSTSVANVPAQLQPFMDKIPPPINGIVVQFFDCLAVPEEAQARASAAAMTIIGLWAVSSAPIISLLVGLLVLIDPITVSKHLEVADAMIRKGLKAAPPVALVPGAVGGIVSLNLLGYAFSLFAWITTLLWVALAAFFAAEVAIAQWKKEQKHSKETPAPAPAAAKAD